MQSVTVAIVMAGAGLEASANETIQNLLDKPSPLVLTTGTKLQMQALKEDRTGNSVGKYQRIAWLFNKEPNEGSAPWQDAATLVLARNSLMHFRPVWDHLDANKEESKIVKALKGKVPIVPAYKSQIVFPHAFMSYGCAKWAVETVLTFCSTFAKLIEADAHLVVPGVDFKLP